MHLADTLTHIIFDPLRPDRPIIVPTLETLEELEAVVVEGLTKLEDERPWHAVDDFDVLESGTFLLDET